MALLPVEEARSRILSNVKPLAAETFNWLTPSAAYSRETLSAKRDQPPFTACAMDGYAVRSEDVAAERKIIGIAAAGHAFKGKLQPAKRCAFSPARRASSADTVVIQENTQANDKIVTMLSPPAPSRTFGHAASISKKAKRCSPHPSD